MIARFEKQITKRNVNKSIASRNMITHYVRQLGTLKTQYKQYIRKENQNLGWGKLRKSGSILQRFLRNSKLNIYCYEVYPVIKLTFSDEINKLVKTLNPNISPS